MHETPSVLAIETACVAAWPALETIEHLSWKARFSRGYTKRANSIQAFDPEDDANAGLRLTAMAGEYRARGLQPIFRITPLASPAISAELDARGWEKFETSLVLTMPAAPAPRGAGVTVRDLPVSDPVWSEAQANMAGVNAEALEVLRLLLARIEGEARGLLVLDEAGEPVAATLAVVANGIGLYYNVVIHPERRGLGLGRAVMQAALDWTEANGARHHAIQVLADNEKAVSLYTSLGFTQAYDYHYRRDLS